MQALYGVVGEFDDPMRLIDASRQMKSEGYRLLEAQTPFPVEELHEVLGTSDSLLHHVAFAGGLAGCIGAYALQYFGVAISYPLNVGGRPLHPWPAFIPLTFELTLLFAALSAFFAMLLFSGLPRLSHPLFTVNNFVLASQDRFFLYVEASDARFHHAETRSRLKELGAVYVHNVAVEASGDAT